MPHGRISPSLTHNKRIFSFFKIIGPEIIAAGNEDLLYVLHRKIRSWSISQGLQVGHEWSEFKIFRVRVLGNAVHKSNLLAAKTLFKMYFMTHASKKQLLI